MDNERILAVLRSHRDILLVSHVRPKVLVPCRKSAPDPLAYSRD